MRLKSIHIKNIRVHQSLRVEFNDSLTLIGGPNESGKSTIAEAVHKALFLKSSGNTEDHRVMRSYLFNDDPEVELVFEVAGNVYTLSKRFSGQSGTTKLSSPAMATLHNDRAESKLSELLKTETGLSRSAYTDKWDNLWIWQGSAFHDPHTFANNTRSNLIRGLQNQGAAVVLQSRTDLAISELISKKTAAIFTSAGKFKAGSIQALAEKTAEEKKDSFEQAKNRLLALENAASQLDQSLEDQKKNEDDLIVVKSELERLNSEQNRLTQLQNEESLLVQQQLQSTNELEERLSEDRKIADLISKNKKVREKLEPLNQEVENIKSAINEKNKSLRSLDNSLNQQAEKNASENKIKEFYQNLKNQLDLEKEVKKLQAEKKKIDSRQGELDQLKRKLAALPDIDQKKITSLERLANQILEAQAAVNSIATSVEILSSGSPVKVNNQKSFKTSFTFTDDTTIEFGKDAKLKVLPGGGTSLLDHKRELDSKTEKLNTLLNEYKVKDLVEARVIRVQRDELIVKIDQAEDFLESMNAGQVSVELLNAEGEHERVSKINNSYAKELKIDIEKEKEHLERKIAEVKNECEAGEKEEKRLRSEIKLLNGKAEEQRNELLEKQQSAEQLNSEYTGNESTIQFLISSYGDEAERLQKINDAKRKQSELQRALDTLQKAIRDLNPEQLEADIKRLKRSEENLQMKRDELIERISNLKTILYFDGKEDPREAYDKYDKQLKAALQEHDFLRRDAEAFKMLNELFIAEQEKLSNELTRPLADRITGYLRCIFGLGVSVKIKDEGGAFTGLSISRRNMVNESPLSFQELSGGAKEQVAAAVRLAMAEVLASDYEGCLPVVFDDAFAYSDPQRIQTIQAMLDYAANQRGLQLIVLSCNPDDYKFLGAKEIRIQ
ncbi:MAG: SMC family ATPase [Bacteroidia bacterium]|nr:SMC family ATPase [Bacteroidia bacterium]